MIFNSFVFIIFFCFVFIVYWFLLNKNLKVQNIFILAASYFFYAWWDWRFLILIFISSLSDFILSKMVYAAPSAKKARFYTIISICINLGILVIFKYFNFFIDNLVNLLNVFGYQANSNTLNIILPVGISFYTFQTMSYTIDVYRKEIKPTSDVFAFFAFVSFFPQLVAGPIERAKNLLVQFEKKRYFSYDNAVIAMQQIIWGFFQKIVIADNCGLLVDKIFENYSTQSGLTLIAGGVLFSIQIYGDFAGYSNIAIGISRLLGFNLMNNFQSPYLSKNITEFWRRWHISLSTWLRDYLYIPLSIKTRNWGKLGLIYSTMLTFLLCGLWHGANWTFVFFGFLHGLALSYEILTKKQRKKWKKKTPKYIYNPLSIFFTLLFWVFTQIIFRSASISYAFNYIKHIFTSPFISNTQFEWADLSYLSLRLVVLFLFISYLGRNELFALEKLSNSWNKWLRLMAYSFLLFLIIMLYPSNGSPFIYFQF